MDDNQLLRYSRQIMLPQLDVAGQEKLLSSTALIIGMGGLGSPAAMYLAAAGVPVPRDDHAQTIAALALEMNGYIQSLPQQNGRPVVFRVGINSGPVVAGVIGVLKKMVKPVRG